MLKYGLFLTPYTNLRLGLEYIHKGSQANQFDASVYHQVNERTTLGSKAKWDLNYKTISNTFALEHKLNNLSTIKGRIDTFGKTDVVIQNKLADQLTAIFTTGGNVSGFFNPKTVDP